MCSKYEAATGWHYHKLLTNLDVRATGDLTLVSMPEILTGALGKKMRAECSLLREK